MQCIYCGKLLPGNVKFCTGCGRPVTGAAADSAAGAVPTAPQPVLPVRTTPVSADRARQIGAGQPYPAPTQYGQAVGQPYAAPARYGQPVRQSAPISNAAELPQRSIAQSRLSFGKSFLSVLLCILLVLFGLCASVLGVVRRTLDGDRIRAAVEKIDVPSTEMPAGDGDTVPLSEFFEQTVEMDLNDAYGISAGELERLLNTSFVKAYVGERLGNFTAYLLGKEELNPLTRNEVVDFFRAHDSEIERITGYSFLDAERDLTNYYNGSYQTSYDLDSIFDSLGSRELDESFLREKTGSWFDVVRRVLSETALLVLIGLSALCLVLLLLVLIRHLRSFFCRTGVSLTVLGGLDLLLGGGGLLGLRATKIGLLYEPLDPIFTGLLIIGSALMVGGILLIVLRRFFQKQTPAPETL